MDADANTPIASASIRFLSSGVVVGETESGEDGRFELPLPTSGAFSLRATAVGYLEEVGPASPPFEIRLTRSCSISGRVTTPTGAPVRGARVEALVRRAVRLKEVGKSAFTDDQGNYRLFGLRPGFYTVRVLPDAQDPRDLLFASLYHPNVTETDRSAFFVLRPSDANRRADFVVHPQPGTTLTGVIQGIPENWDAYHIAVTVFSAQGEKIATTLATPTGEFRFAGLWPGRYRLVAWGPIYGGNGAPVALQHGRTGSQSVDLSSDDQPKLVIELRDQVTVTVRASHPNVDCTTAGVRASLEPVDILPQDRDLAAPFDGRAARITDVPLGQYRLRLTGLATGCYAKSARSFSVTEDLELPLQLAATKTVVSGSVKVLEGSTVPADLLVALVDVDSSENTRIAIPAGTGTFQFDRVVPGSYRVLAVRGLFDPSLASGQAGVALAVGPDSTITIEVIFRQ